MDRNNHTPLEGFELNELNLIDVPVYGPDDYKIGVVSGLRDDSALRQVIMDMDGFLGIGSRSTAIPLTDIVFMQDQDGNVHGVTHLTKDQLEKLPEDTGLPLPPVV